MVEPQNHIDFNNFDVANSLNSLNSKHLQRLVGSIDGYNLQHSKNRANRPQNSHPEAIKITQIILQRCNSLLTNLTIYVRLFT